MDDTACMHREGAQYRLYRFDVQPKALAYDQAIAWEFQIPYEWLDERTGRPSCVRLYKHLA